MISIPIIAVISAASILAVLITQKLEGRYLKAVTLMLVIALPILFITYASGIQNAQAGGYPAVKNAGEWMDQNTPEDARILSTSFRQIMYQAYPRIAWMPPGNESALRKDIDRRNISYVVIDTYEKAQPGYTQLKIPPHRVPNDMRQQLANRQISGQEVVDQFEQAPEFLTPLKQFGQSRVIPFRQIQQPRVIVYRVNKTALQ